MEIVQDFIRILRGRCVIPQLSGEFFDNSSEGNIMSDLSVKASVMPGLVLESLRFSDEGSQSMVASEENAPILSRYLPPTKEPPKEKQKPKNVCNPRVEDCRTRVADTGRDIQAEDLAFRALACYFRIDCQDYLDS